MDSIAAVVRSFYDQLPFNYDRSTAQAARTIRESNQLEVYAPLAAQLQATAGARVLDLGCGAGWFVNTVVQYYDAEAWGVDFCASAVERARATAAVLGHKDAARFVEADLFALPTEFATRRFDIVNSLGALHHTVDCPAAVAVACSLVKTGGFLHLGLYHRPSRAPLLERFEPFRTRWQQADSTRERQQIEEAAFELWQRFGLHKDDETFARSWFRDQCFHPHETQWTLAEILPLVEEQGLEPLCTSLDRFAPKPDWQALLATEHQCREIAQQRIEQDNFYPGFFILWARRGPGPQPK